MSALLDRRPIVVALAGPNGAGKSTFYRAHLAASGLRFVNADELASQLKVDAYTAAALADQIRREMVGRGESFIFETVFSDPAGDKIDFLKAAVRAGYMVALFFIGIDSTRTSEQRVAMRVLKGGHDVPTEKIESRYARTMENLRRAFVSLPYVRAYDNSDLRRPYRLVVELESGTLRTLGPVPGWLKPLLPEH